MHVNAAIFSAKGKITWNQEFQEKRFYIPEVEIDNSNIEERNIMMGVGFFYELVYFSMRYILSWGEKSPLFSLSLVNSNTNHLVRERA